MNDFTQTTNSADATASLSLEDLQGLVEEYKFLREHSELNVSPKLYEYIRGLGETTSPHVAFPDPLGVRVVVDPSLRYYDYRWAQVK